MELESSKFTAEHKVDRTHQTEACPEIVELEFFLEVKDRKRHKHRQGNHFLDYFKLAH